MKHQFFLIAIISLTYFSCSKPGQSDPIPLSLDGKWRMVLVTDHSSGVRTAKPSSIQKDVDLVFMAAGSAGGTFSGNTPTNDIFENEYVTGADQALTILYLNMTKVGETSWGYEFVNNILNSRDYSFGGDGSLNIETTGKTLTFKKL